MVEVMTDKATVEIPSPRAGKVVQRMFAEGQICPVGKVLIAIDDVDEAAGERGGRRRQGAHPPPRAAAAAGRSAGEQAERGRTRRDAGGAGDAGDAQAGARPAASTSAGDGHRPGRPDHLGRRARAPRRRVAPAAARARAPSPDRARRTTCASRSAACARRSPSTWRTLKQTAPHFTYVEEVDVHRAGRAAGERANARAGASAA